MPSIHQEVVFDATPAQVYDALMRSEQHAAFTGAPADIDVNEGGAWSAYGGGISGRHIELVPAKRVVQSWRAGGWQEGVHSLVRFELSPEGSGTRVVLEHLGFPDETRTHLEEGWKTMYWGPLEAFFAG